MRCMCGYRCLTKIYIYHLPGRTTMKHVMQAQHVLFFLIKRGASDRPGPLGQRGCVGIGWEAPQHYALFE